MPQPSSRKLSTGMLGPDGRREILDQPPLPSGRHKIARDVVVATQRARILAAVVEVVDTHGYEVAVVERIASRAGVSRRTFYEQFDGREDAFLSGYDAESDRLVAEVRAATADAKALDDAVLGALRAILEALAEDPAVARLLVVEILLAGPAALARRDALMHRFALDLERAARTHRGTPLPALTAEGLVGAVYDVLYKRVAAGDATQLPELLDDLHGFCLAQLRPSPSDVPVI